MLVYASPAIDASKICFGNKGSHPRPLPWQRKEGRNLQKTSVTDGFFWRCKARSGTVIEPISNPRPLRCKPLPHGKFGSTSGKACSHELRANLGTTCHSPGIWTRGLVKTLDHRLNAILRFFGCIVQALEGKTSGQRTCAVSPSGNVTAQSPYRTTQIVNRFRPDHSVIVAVTIPVIVVHRTQVVLVDCFADSQPQQRSCVLVGSKMDPAVNTSVADVVGNLPERG